MKKPLFSVLVAFVLAFGLIFGFTAPASAQTHVTVDISKLPSDQAAAVLEAQKAATNPVAVIPTTAKLKEWAGLGKEIGTVIAEVCRELSIGVNEFVKTPVGKITMYLIVWKVAGQELWGIVGGIGAWVAITAILLWSFTRFHVAAKIKNKETGEVKYIPRYEFTSKDARATSAAVHVIIFVVVTAVCMLIIF